MIAQALHCSSASVAAQTWDHEWIHYTRVVFVCTPCAVSAPENGKWMCDSKSKQLGGFLNFFKCSVLLLVPSNQCAPVLQSCQAHLSLLLKLLSSSIWISRVIPVVCWINDSIMLIESQVWAQLNKSPKHEWYMKQCVASNNSRHDTSNNSQANYFLPKHCILLL